MTYKITNLILHSYFLWYHYSLGKILLSVEYTIIVQIFSKKSKENSLELSEMQHSVVQMLDLTLGGH